MNLVVKVVKFIFLFLCFQQSLAENETKHAELEGEHGHGHGHHGYTVFHEDFKKVQLPFIISLWIVLASIFKIGKI